MTLRRELGPAALGLCLVLAPQLLGGVYPWGMLAICALALGAVSVAGVERRVPTPTLLAALALGLLWTGLQALPLPCALSRLAAPDAALELARTHALLGLDPPRWCTLSRDPAATREEIIKGIAIVASFCAAIWLAARGARRRVLWYIAAALLGLALSAAVHAAVGAGRVYGVYAPVEFRELPFVAPILNPNTLGGLMAAGVPLMLGLGLSAERNGARALAIAGAAALTAVALMSQSRGAVFALLVGALAYASLELARRLRSSSRTGRAGRAGRADRPRSGFSLERHGAALAAVLALGLVVFGLHGPVARELARGGWDKLALIAAAGGQALQAPLVGVGRGAFASAFVGHSSGAARFEHAENFPVQWAMEWGLPVAGLILLACGYHLWRAIRSARSPERIGAIAALLALCAQNLLDLGFELVGVAVLASALLGAVVVAPGGRSPHAPHELRASSPRLRGVPRPGLSLWLLASLTAAWLAPGVMRDHGPWLEDALRAASPTADQNRLEQRALVQRALLAHPAEPSLVVLVAVSALARGDRHTGRYINRAMELAPTWASPHALAATWLHGSGRVPQALIEVREALRRDPHGMGSLLCWALGAHRDAAVQLIPDGEHRALVMERAAQCLGYNSKEARLLDARQRAEFPREPAPRLRQARRLLEDERHDAALAELEPIPQAHPLAPAAVLLRAEILHSAGRHREVLARVAGGVAQLDDPFELRILEARAHAGTADRAATELALDRLRALAAGDSARRLRVLALEGALLPALGDPQRAIASLMEAYDITSDIKHLRAVVSVAEGAGTPARAVVAYRELCRRVPGEEHACRRVRQLPGGAGAMNTEVNSRH